MLRRFLSLITGGLLLLTAGCGILTLDEDRPEVARVTITGSPDSSLELLVSNQFVQGTSAQSGQLQIQFLEADTLPVSVPLDQSFDLGPNTRIFLRLSNRDSVTTRARMEVLLDDRQAFDREGDLGVDEVFQFSFVHQSTR